MAITRNSQNLRVVLALPAVSGQGPLPQRQPPIPVPTGNIIVNDDEVDRALPALPVQGPIPRGQPRVPKGTVAKAGEVVRPRYQKKIGAKAQAEPKLNEALLPDGTPLLSVAGETLPKSAVGPALEFLEFCAAFYEPLQMKEVEAQMTLREIVHGCKLKKAWQSQVVRVHVRLLSVILDEGDESVSPRSESENSWLKVLKSYLHKKAQPRLKDAEGDESNSMDADAGCSSKPSPPSSDSVASSSNSAFSPFQISMHKYAVALEGGADGYLNFAVEEKLQLLNILCNDALSTEVLRRHIEKVIAEDDEKRKEVREKKKEIKAGKSKSSTSEPSTEGKMTGSVRTRSALKQPSDNLPETSDSFILGNTETLRSDAVKSEAVVWDNGSRALWKLKGGDDRTALIFQVISDIGGTPKEEWTLYSEKDKEALSVYLNQKKND